MSAAHHMCLTEKYDFVIFAIAGCQAGVRSGMEVPAGRTVREEFNSTQ